jgi:hypothetical protein
VAEGVTLARAGIIEEKTAFSRMERAAPVKPVLTKARPPS